MPRLLERIRLAIRELGLGSADTLSRYDMKAGLNLALRQIGAKTVLDMDDPIALRMAANALEEAV